MLVAALTGFLTSASLILAVGAQNAFVLRQGLLRRHVGPLVAFCTLSDAVLIAAGVAGFGWVTAAVPWLPRAMVSGGAAFLLVYGAMRFRAAWTGDYAMALAGEGGTLGRTIGVAAAITWLNPHVYLDTLALLGAISTTFEGAAAKVAFALGAILASGAFFALLGYGARLLAPVMRSARAWRTLDVSVGAVMWAIAAGLILGVG